jgi:hypothetical protein
MPSPVTDHSIVCDILVAGGGAAGVPCALAAARNGARVLLCHDRPVLGGNASGEVRMHIVGANGFGKADRGAPLETEAREGGIIEEIRLENCVANPQRSPSMFDLILFEKCRAEPNLTLLLNTTVIGVEKDGSRIVCAFADRPSTEDRFRVEAKIFVDCTGDGRLGVEAGAPFMDGRESRQQFGERLAPERADTKRLGSSLLLMARRHDRAMPFVPPLWARKFSKQELKLRLYAMPGDEAPSLEYGFWWAEWGGHLDTIKDNERIRDELLALVMGIWDHIKNVAWPEHAAHWALDWFGFVPGKRESRRFLGQHVLTEQDVLQSRAFEDAIAYGGWPIDLHPPEGVDAPNEPPCVQHEVPWLYDIPLRACVSRDVPNLMFAGRNMSATHVAFASTRVMATCAVVGQGVGTAAAYVAAAGIELAQLAGNASAVHAIQQMLLRDDCYLIGKLHRDPNDLARDWFSGQTRCVHGKRGAPPDRASPGSHRWMSKGLPGTLELRWPRPIRPRRIQLIFDTGLHRHLTLTHHDSYCAQMIWGRPQPETVRDFRIEGLMDARWQPLIDVAENYQRRRVHELTDPPAVTALRVVVTATNGLDHARICGMSVWETL